MLLRYDSDLSIHRVTAIRDVDPETGDKLTAKCLVEIDNDNTKGYAVDLNTGELVKYLI